MTTAIADAQAQTIYGRLEIWRDPDWAERSMRYMPADDADRKAVLQTIADREGCPVSYDERDAVWGWRTRGYAEPVTTKAQPSIEELNTPPDDCPCGCEGDVESHRGGNTGEAYRKAGM